MLGGSFDPIHFGHLRLAEEAAHRLGLARVFLIPTRPWQRSTQADAHTRLHMAELACLGNRRLLVDRHEVDHAGPSYTVETLTHLRSRIGVTAPLWLILGADAFLRLPSWKNWGELAGLCHIAVVPRPGVDLAADLPLELQSWWQRRTSDVATGAAGGLCVLNAPALEISATAIRLMLREGRSPRYLLPDQVLDYIELQGVYPQEVHEP